jgi:20S proteasome alpha/beta subunit
MLALKPRLPGQGKFRRVPVRKGMTIAIGTYFADGVILCADTKFVDDNGNISYGGKISSTLGGNGRTFAIAHAANDSNAAAMVATDILHALDDSGEQYQFGPIIKKCMTRWLSDYAQSSVPLLQFLVACSAGRQSSLYFCQPPNIVIQKYRLEPVAIGSALKTVEALLPIVLMHPKDEEDPDSLEMTPESTLLKLAYLMRRAKSEDLYAGGDTDAVVLYRDGTFAETVRTEMKDAEEFSEKLDFYFKYICYGFFSQQSEEDQRAFMDRFKSLYLRDAKTASKMWFPSLEDLGT